MRIMRLQAICLMLAVISKRLMHILLLLLRQAVC